jgi:hypothetical protein
VGNLSENYLGKVGFLLFPGKAHHQVISLHQPERGTAELIPVHPVQRIHEIRFLVSRAGHFCSDDIVAETELIAINGIAATQPVAARSPRDLIGRCLELQPGPALAEDLLEALGIVREQRELPVARQIARLAIFGGCAGNKADDDQQGEDPFHIFLQTGAIPGPANY